MKIFKKTITAIILLAAATTANAMAFNNKLTKEEISKLQNGEVIIRDIGNAANICLNKNLNPMADEVINSVINLKPKYLAEVITITPYEGNEDLPEKLEALLLDVEEYTHIPYWSVRYQKFYDLYDSATVLSTETKDNQTKIMADFLMYPFDILHEEISIKKESESLLYSTKNKKNLLYNGKIFCIGADKFTVNIVLIKEDNQWILYGIGGVNAAKVPMLEDRIQTAFINRIKDFCTYIFKNSI